MELIWSGMNRGLLCPGYQRPLRWSQKYEKAAQVTTSACVSPTLNLSTPVSRGHSPSDRSAKLAPSRRTGPGTLGGSGLDAAKDPTQPTGIPAVQVEESYSCASRSISLRIASARRVSPSAFRESVLFVQCYSSLLARVLSIYDGLFNPFRAAALSKWGRSSLLFSVFKFFVGVYRMACHSSSQLRLAMDEARLETLGQLSVNLSSVTNWVATQNNDVLLVINMFGLSSSWYDLSDLGLEHYTAAAALVREGHGITSRNRRFFEEFLVYWWMMLSFAHSSDPRHPQNPPTLSHKSSTEPRMPHPLTGVSPESQLLVGMVARLVLSQRRIALEQDTTTADAVLISVANVKMARHLEHELVSLQLPPADLILDPGDPHTSVQDLLEMARAYRMGGLLLLYHAYPDLLTNNAYCSPSFQATNPAFSHPGGKRSRLRSLAFDVLHLLGQISPNSGTRTIEAILLVIVSGELSLKADATQPPTGNTTIDASPYPSSNTESCDSSKISTRQAVLNARAVVIARFERIQAILPFGTIRRMRSLVLETWRLMDSGFDVSWVDLLIMNKWEFLMI
ncbi:hypothetical protein PV04_02100 [Phialophora macrospora]|uniref:Transcription factor domain-containing protein n=1 Tax=Phialophora macrospora TaxID=1851006 RepID=A0A0D2EI78_9EURO|nr:hypothetical protein PV04_02100 [Phialophora macrospora]